MKKLVVLFLICCTALCAQAKKFDFETKASPLTLKMFDAISQSNAKKVKSLLKKVKSKADLDQFLYAAAFTCATNSVWYHNPHFTDTKPDEYTFIGGKWNCDAAQNEEIIRLLIDAGARTDTLTYYYKNKEKIAGSDKERTPLGLQTILHFLKKGNPQAAKNLLSKIDSCTVSLTEMTDADPNTPDYTKYANSWYQRDCSTDKMKLVGIWYPDNLPFMIGILSSVYTSEQIHAMTLGKTEKELTAFYKEGPIFTQIVSPHRKILTYRAIQQNHPKLPQGPQDAVDYIYTMDNGIATHISYVTVIFMFDKDDLWDPEFVEELKTKRYY